MRTKEQGKKDVVLHMNVLAQDLMNIIKKSSEEGQKFLISIIDETKKQYLQRRKAMVQGVIYSFTRLREEDINNHINNIQKASAARNQVAEVKALLSQGKWNIESFNTLFLLHLVSKTNAYWMPSNKFMHEEIIPRLKDLLFAKMNTFMISEAAEEKKIPLVVKEPVKTGRINMDNFAHVAAIFAKDAPRKTTPQPEPGRINVANYAAVAKLFGPVKEQAPKPGRIKNLEDFAAVADLFAAPRKSV